MSNTTAVVLGEYAAQSESGRAGGARVFAARQSVTQAATSGLRFARLVLLTVAPSPVDPAAELRRAAHYASGVRELSPALGAAWPTDFGENAPDAVQPLLLGFQAASPRTLDDALATGEQLDPDHLSRLIGRLAAGLAALHDQGVAHGQLRADFVALGENERPLLEGFGLGQVLLTLGGARAARDAQPPEYRAPELGSALPMRADAKCDVYALGVLVSEMLARRRARPGDRCTPRGLGASVSERLEQLVAMATAPAIAERPMDVLHWANRVAAVIREELPAKLASRPPNDAVEPTFAQPMQVFEPTPPPPAPLPSVAPSPAPADVPVSNMPPASVPPPFPPHHEFDSARPRSTPIAMLVFILLGALLMCGGVGALFGYRLVQAKRVAVRLATTASVAFGVPTPPSASLSAAPPLVPAPSGSARSSEPENEERDPASANDEPPNASSVPPLPDRGVRGVQAEDGLSPLPLDTSVPIWGPPGAPVTIVLFGDLECPHTRKSLGVLTRLKASFKDELRLAFRHRPLPAHAYAKGAAEVAARVHLDAGDAAFWGMLEQASQSSGAPSEAELLRWRSASSATVPDAGSLRATPASKARVARDLELAGQYNVRATPTFFINGARVEGEKSFSELRRLIVAERKTALATLASGTRRQDLYLVRTKKNLINVGPDVIERTCPKIAGSPAFGAVNARVTVVEFSDFECAYCKQIQPTLSQLRARYSRDLRLVWKNFPLEQHDHARAAAALALHIFESRGPVAFWKVHDQLFKQAPDLDDATLLGIAKRESLTPEVSREILTRADRNPKISADIALGERLGVSGTPTFFVNGRRVTGARPLSEFKRLVDEELEAAERLIATGTEPQRVYDVLCGQ